MTIYGCVLPVRILAFVGGRLKDNSMYLAMKRLKPVPIENSMTMTKVTASQHRFRINLRIYLGKSGNDQRRVTFTSYC